MCTVDTAATANAAATATAGLSPGTMRSGLCQEKNVWSPSVHCRHCCYCYWYCCCWTLSCCSAHCPAQHPSYWDLYTGPLPRSLSVVVMVAELLRQLYLQNWCSSGTCKCTVMWLSLSTSCLSPLSLPWCPGLVCQRCLFQGLLPFASFDPPWLLIIKTSPFFHQILKF